MLEKKSQTFHYYLRIAFISMLPFPPRSPPFSSLYIFFAFDWRFIWYPSSFVPNMIYHILRISVQSLINICFFHLINTWKWNLKKSRSGFDYCQVSTTVRFGRIFIPDLFRFSLLLLLLSLYFFWYNFYFKEWVTNPSCSGIMYSFLGFFYVSSIWYWKNLLIGELTQFFGLSSEGGESELLLTYEVNWGHDVNSQCFCFKLF